MTSTELFSRGPFAAVALAMAMTVTTAWAGVEKLSPELKSLNAGPDVEVIVQYKVAPTEAHHRKIADLGGRLHVQMKNIKAAHYTVPASELRTLADDPDVTYISPNRIVKGALNITAGTVHSNAANTDGYTGKGIGVAVVDSGVSNMQEFQPNLNRIVYSECGTPPG